MPRNGELSFYETIGEAGREFCRNKPFSLDECGIELMQIGAIMTLLPPPPARILECGCGAGWLSKLLAKRGYDVVGTDVSSQAIEIANSDRKGVELSNPTFVVADTEELPFTAEFDVVIFYDSLHHAIDERESLVAAFRALKPGGDLHHVGTGSGSRSAFTGRDRGVRRHREGYAPLVCGEDRSRGRFLVEQVLPANGPPRTVAVRNEMDRSGSTAKPEIHLAVQVFDGHLPDDVRETTLRNYDPLQGIDRRSRSSLRRSPSTHLIGQNRASCRFPPLALPRSDLGQRASVIVRRIDVHQRAK